MIDSRLIKRVSQEVGSGPAIAWYLERMQLQETIDRCVPAHRNRTELSHGQAVVGLVTMILNHSHALYHMEEWAKNSHILSQVLPGVPAAAYTDDRLGDTLDALFAVGLDGVQSQVSWAICQAFQLPVQAVHCATTTVSFFGAYEEGETLAGPNASGVPVAPRITYGYSKQHRPDWKQLLLSLSVNEEQLPLLGTVLDGNTADAHTYLKQWLAISQMLRRSDFLFLGDSKLASRKNLRAIMDRAGVFLSAATLTPKLKKELQKKVTKKGAPTWRPFLPIPGQVSAEAVKGYTYVKRLIKIGSGRPYRIRQLIIRSEALARRHAATRQKHLTAFQQRLQTLNGKLNQYQLKTQEQIENALDTLRRRYPQAAALVRVRLTYTTEVRKRLCGPGRAGKHRK